MPAAKSRTPDLQSVHCAGAPGPVTRLPRARVSGFAIIPAPLAPYPWASYGQSLRSALLSPGVELKERQDHFISDLAKNGIDHTELGIVAVASRTALSMLTHVRK